MICKNVIRILMKNKTYNEIMKIIKENILQKKSTKLSNYNE